MNDELRKKIAIFLAEISANSKKDLYAIEDAGDSLFTFITQYAEEREAKAKVEQTQRCDRQTRLMESSEVRKEWFAQEVARLKEKQ